MRPISLAVASLMLQPGSTLAVSNDSDTAPLVTTKNGTYQGRYLPGYDQDIFLGMPYAQPPVGDLRFRWPRSVNESFDGVRDASQYGYSCMQYRSSFNISEDCLNLNVIRPAGGHTDLPVLVWVYGGKQLLDKTFTTSRTEMPHSPPLPHSLCGLQVLRQAMATLWSSPRRVPVKLVWFSGCLMANSQCCRRSLRGFDGRPTV